MGRNLIATKCDMCGKPLLRRRSEIRATSFCDLYCRNAYQRGGVIINDELKQAVIEMYEAGVHIHSIEECFCISSTLLYEIIDPSTFRRH